MLKVKSVPIKLKKLLLFIAALLTFLFTLHKAYPLPPKKDYSTIVKDRNGELLHAYLSNDDKWRLATDLSEISPLLKKTILSKEDKYFYYHLGVNPFSLAKSLLRNAIRGKRISGASTITMQVARMLEPKKRTYFNKLKEIARAFQLEFTYSKDEILQLYINLVPYGGNIEGVKTASYLFFNKNPDHLSLAEITALTIIPNRPNSLRIKTSGNEELKKQRNKWLQMFLKQKIFTPSEIQDALQEPIPINTQTMPRLAPHLCQKLKNMASQVASTLDLNTQLKTEKILSDYAQSQRLIGIRNACAIVIDNATREVISYVGSANFFDTLDGGQVNGAKALRQPGSTLKPFLYALAIDKGLVTPRRILTDVPINYQGYAPENYDRSYSGYVSMEYALEHSLNIPAVKTLASYGQELFTEKLANAGFTNISSNRQKLGLSMILGGCGASLEELAGLYCALANDGNFKKLKYLKGGADQLSTPLISPAASFLITDILSKVNRPDFPLSWSATENMPKIAWKTGTSYGRRDAWSIGYNKKYTIAVWVGNFSGQGNAALSGAHTATPLLFKLFNTIDYNNDKDWFRPPASLDLRMVCAETGLLPGPHCTDLVTDYFIPLISSQEICANQQEMNVSPAEQFSYCPYCLPAAGYKTKTYKIIEPEMQYWMLEHLVPFAPLPPHNPNCERISLGNGPAIIAPIHKTEYLISTAHPEPLQLICQASAGVQKVDWYVNKKLYKSVSPKQKEFFMPQEGPVEITCVDDKGQSRTINITVKFIDL